MTPNSQLNCFAPAIGMFGGLALFLYGLDQFSEGLKQAAGDTLKTQLTRLTANRFLGALTGAMVTGILNSTSVTTVLVVGFVTASVMMLAQAVKAVAEKMAADGLRVLTFARKKLDHDTLKMEDVEEGLTFLGLQGMIDPPHQSVP